MRATWALGAALALLASGTSNLLAPESCGLPLSLLLLLGDVGVVAEPVPPPPVIPDEYSAALLERVVQSQHADNLTLAGYMYVSRPASRVRLELASFGQTMTVFWNTATGAQHIVFVAGNGQLFCTNATQPYPAIPQSLKYNGQAPCGYNGGALCNRYDFSVAQGAVVFAGSVFADAATNAWSGEVLTCTSGGLRVFSATVMFDGFSPSVPQTPGFFEPPPLCGGAAAPAKADELLLRALPRHPLFL
jgi:hypothetical protein